MEFDTDFNGYQQWVEGSKQIIIGEPGDTKEDVVNFMHAHLDYFDLRGKFTFNAAHIEQDGNIFIVTINKLGGNPRANRLRLGYGIQPEIDSASEK